MILNLWHHFSEASTPFPYGLAWPSSTFSNTSHRLHNDTFATFAMFTKCFVFSLSKITKQTSVSCQPGSGKCFCFVFFFLLPKAASKCLGIALRFHIDHCLPRLECPAQHIPLPFLFHLLMLYLYRFIKKCKLDLWSGHWEARTMQQCPGVKAPTPRPSVSMPNRALLANVLGSCPFFFLSLSPLRSNGRVCLPLHPIRICVTTFVCHFPFGGKGSNKNKKSTSSKTT